MRYHLLHIGIGNVGRTVVKQILEQGPTLKRDQDIELVYCGLFTSSSGDFEPGGLTAGQIQAFPATGSANLMESIDAMPQPFIVIDTTASTKMVPALRRALDRGGAVVMANKKPLSGPGHDFEALHKAGPGRLYYEATVGAGLPVIQVLKNLIDTGDSITSIQGCFSGTLGFVLSQLQSGKLFSDSVKEAMKRGFTDPDPRDDLSGMDVARKALILARMLGQSLEIEDMKVEKLYPTAMEALSPDEFIEQVDQLDHNYQHQAEQAHAAGQVLRYTATVTPDTCRVGLEQVDRTSGVGCLTGADNIIVIHTKRYADTPLIIQGPGAGLEVTAAGVFGDILEAARAL